MIPVSPARARARRSQGVRRASGLLVLTAAALAAATAARLPAAWRSGNALNHVSGAWFALADDLAHGTFYRAVHDPTVGYGGTRFFPLVFAMHAGLRAAGAGLLEAGYALSLAAGLLSVGAVALFLRRAGLPRPAAVSFGLLGLGAFATQHALAASRADLLPAALCALGLAILARGPTRRTLAGAAIVFTLAFAAKPTALTAPAAAVLWLALRRERREAAALAAGVVGGAFGVVALTEVLSGGRFLAIVGATAAGGAGLKDLLLSPVRVAQHFTIADPSALALVCVAAGATLAAAPARLRAAREGRGDARLLAGLWFVLAGVALLVVFASPGTGVNHLVEIEIASALALGVAWPCRDTAGRLARSLAPMAGALGIAVALGMAREDARVSRLDELAEVAAEVPPRAPVLSEDPLLSVVLGERPFVLDTWMLRLVAERDPAVEGPLLDAIRRQEFAVIVLFHTLGTPAADVWYARNDLGTPVARAIAEHYRLEAVHGRYRVYVPVARAPDAAAPIRPASPARGPVRAAAGRVTRATAAR